MENKKFHILIVDDDNRIRDLLKDTCLKIIILFRLQKMQTKQREVGVLKFDIIILDVMMPGQNGYELTKELKNKIKVPIILLTAKGEVENRIKGLELGADDYIGKPFEPKNCF